MPRKADVADPNYYHKVVDCQWACPAHTPVPEYIRLIAQGRFSDAYILNRESNVFPGILGRVCDRPCEPACRRGRIEEEPVAICRLKRVAADLRGDIQERLPEIPQKKNGKHIALIGAGPASLTVANDLMPLGYSVTIFEKEKLPGGAMRSNVPMFRLPESVLDEEIAMIVGMGVTMRYGEPVTSMKALLNSGKFDAVFIGSGAPIGRDLKLPGLDAARAQVHIGIEWLANVAFAHVDKVQKRVLVIGGGNTAMDCCRTARRIGGEDVKVVAPESYEQMLASPWEKVDAAEEKIPIMNFLLPQEYLVKAGKLTGVRFQHLRQCYDAQKKWAPIPSGQPDVVLPCDEVILAIGQERAFPYIERDSGVAFDDKDRPIVDTRTFQSANPKVFFGGDAAFGPKNIIWAVAHGHDAAISIHKFMQGEDVKVRPAPGLNLVSQKMGMHEWSYDNEFSGSKRVKVPHVDVDKRLKELKLEVELGYDVKLAVSEASRCLNCDVQTVFAEDLCIECDACVDICPLSCLTITGDGSEGAVATHLTAPALHFPQQDLLISDALKDTGRVMVKDEDLCLHCGLCAERCPTGAWDMQKSLISIPKAGDASR